MRSRCRALHSYHEWFAVSSQIVIGVMLILRTYALYERNRRVLALMVFVSVGGVAVGASKPGDEVPQLDLDIGCSTGLTSAQSIGLAAAWAGMGFFDCTIFLLTLYKAFSRFRAPGLDLVTVLLRDGSIYFGVILLVNLSNILTFVVAGPYARGAPTTLANAISSVMITRLMLNLRDPSLSSMVEDSRRVRRSHARLCFLRIWMKARWLGRDPPIALIPTPLPG
ncbi:hypothetical protein B0H12DRAFT_1235779 [Mycena haematopus]|nr:hypothetical protein B0H12DRAFT_1235779 [Mycena haematopus]